MARPKKSGFRWKPGASAPVPADVAGAELERIRLDNDGVLRPSDVVEESRPDDAPLHPAFEWDDERAAELYRQDQARRVIRGLTVVDLGRPDAEPQPVYLHVSNAESPRSQSYMAAVEVLRDADLRQRALAEALAQLRGMERRYGHLQELSQVFRAAKSVPSPVAAAV